MRQDGWLVSADRHAADGLLIWRRREVQGDAYAELWLKLVAASPALGEFQAMAARQIPLFTLTQTPPGR